MTTVCKGLPSFGYKDKKRGKINNIQGFAIVKKKMYIFSSQNQEKVLCLTKQMLDKQKVKRYQRLTLKKVLGPGKRKKLSEHPLVLKSPSRGGGVLISNSVSSSDVYVNRLAKSGRALVAGIRGKKI